MEDDPGSVLKEKNESSMAVALKLLKDGAIILENESDIINQYCEIYPEYFNINSNTEITLELNPDDANFEYLKSLRDVGINRLSIGSQTFNDKILQIIGRRHDSKQTIQAVNLAQKAGLENISLDSVCRKT